MRTKNNDLTQGNIYRTLIAFGIPFLLANFIQALYGAVDMAVVGWFSGKATVAAVSIGTQITQLLNSLISGLTMGGTILIAQYVGAKKEKDVRETIGTMLTLFGAAALIFTAVMLLIAPLALRLIRTPQEAMAGAKQYVYVCSGGILFIFGYNAISAILRGLGDSKRPVIFIAVACCANILLDLLFVGVFRWGAGGAAFATVLSQGISLFLSIGVLRGKDFLFDFSRGSFRIQKEKALRIFKVGLPVSLQSTILSVSFLFITAVVNTLGVVATAATGICGKFDSFAMLPPEAFSGALATIAGQNIGAGKPERAKKALHAAIALSLCSALLFFVWAQGWPESIMAIFKAEPEVAAAGAQYMKTFSFDFLLVCFGFCMNGFFNGCGRTLFVMVNGGAASLCIRLPMAWAMSHMAQGSLAAIGLAAPIATAISIVAAFVYLRTGKWKSLAI